MVTALLIATNSDLEVASSDFPLEFLPQNCSSEEKALEAFATAFEAFTSTVAFEASNSSFTTLEVGPYPCLGG